MTETSKRELVRIGIAGLAAVAGSNAIVTWGSAAERKGKGLPKKGEEETVTPPEDLMREHGVLDRTLLIYEAGMRKFAAKEDFDPSVLTRSAEVIRDFINNYHEKSEEAYLFPRFRKAGQMVELVETLLMQHQAGRRLTEVVLRTAPASRSDGDERRQAISAMQSFITMYRPHAAREDTELFPKLQAIVSKHEYEAMAEDFEKQEHKLFGEDGFEKMVQRVASLEQAVGIADLKQFTPR